MIRPAKYQAREDTIINAYRKIFNNDSLPANKQYWTMCSRCSNSNDTKFGNEYEHIIGSGLITPSQWHGVDKDENIINLNQRDYPHVTWIAGDFYRKMSYYSNFRPGIVNIDTMSMAANATPFVGKILNLLSKTEGDLMVVVNIVTKFSHIESRAASIEEFLKLLRKDPNYIESYQRNSWEFDNEAYPYADISEMTSLILYRKTQ